MAMILPDTTLYPMNAISGVREKNQNKKRSGPKMGVSAVWWVPRRVSPCGFFSPRSLGLSRLSAPLERTRERRYNACRRLNWTAQCFLYKTIDKRKIMSSDSANGMARFLCENWT